MRGMGRGGTIHGSSYLPSSRHTVNLPARLRAGSCAKLAARGYVHVRTGNDASRSAKGDAQWYTCTVHDVPLFAVQTRPPGMPAHSPSAPLAGSVGEAAPRNRPTGRSYSVVATSHTTPSSRTDTGLTSTPGHLIPQAGVSILSPCRAVNWVMGSPGRADSTGRGRRRGRHGDGPPAR